MFSEKCKGSTLNLVHPSHSVRTTAGVIWCTRCGSFATRRPRLLAKECSLRPRTEPQRNVLRRLTLNLAPTTASYLADVAFDNGGVRGADNGLAEEVAWIKTRADASIDTRTSHVKTPTAATMAMAPTGRYARSPGGHLFKPRALAASERGRQYGRRGRTFSQTVHQRDVERASCIRRSPQHGWRRQKQRWESRQCLPRYPCAELDI